MASDVLLQVNMLAIKKNLKDYIFCPGFSDVFAKCPICGAEYSANAGDYWQLKDNDRLKCCDKTMILCRKSTKIIEL